MQKQEEGMGDLRTAHHLISGSMRSSARRLPMCRKGTENFQLGDV